MRKINSSLDNLQVGLTFSQQHNHIFHSIRNPIHNITETMARFHLLYKY